MEWEEKCIREEVLCEGVALKMSPQDLAVSLLMCYSPERTTFLTYCFNLGGNVYFIFHIAVRKITISLLGLPGFFETCIHV